MLIDHISMYASNPDRLKEFYETYFGAKSNRLRLNEEAGIQSYFLTFDEGPTKLQIINRPEIDDMSKNHIDLGYIRIAFEAESREDVNRQAQRLKEDGFVILKKPAARYDGYYDCTVLDPDDNQVKIIYGEHNGEHDPLDEQVAAIGQ